MAGDGVPDQGNTHFDIDVVSGAAIRARIGFHQTSLGLQDFVWSKWVPINVYSQDIRPAALASQAAFDAAVAGSAWAGFYAQWFVTPRHRFVQRGSVAQSPVPVDADTLQLPP